MIDMLPRAGGGVLILCLLLAHTTAAEVMTARIVVTAGDQPRPAGERVELVEPIQSRLAREHQMLAATLNPRRVRLTTDADELVEYAVEAVRIEGDTEQYGVRFLIVLPQPISPGRQAGFRLMFEPVGHEMIRHQRQVELAAVTAVSEPGQAGVALVELARAPGVALPGSKDHTAPALAAAPRAARPRPAIRDFFRPAADRGMELPADGIYPRGRRFGFSLYSVGGTADRIDARGERLDPPLDRDEVVVRAVKRVAADGFTMIGPQYELNHRIIADAEAAGLKCIFSVGIDDGGYPWINFHEDDKAAYDPSELAERIRAQIAPVVDSDTIAWWDVSPEELRWWRAAEMQYLEIMTRTIREMDPKQRPIYMYEPNHFGVDSLVKTIACLDASSKGVYANYASHMLSRGPFIRWSIEQEIEAIRASGREHAIPIVVPEMFQQPPEEYASFPSTWARHDTWLGLVCGGRAVIVFSMRHRNGFSTHNDYYEGFASVAREINGELKLGDVLLFGEQREDLAITITSGPAQLVFEDRWRENAVPTEYPPVAWRSMQYGHDRYLFAVNSAYEPVEALLEGLPQGSVTIEDLTSDKATIVTAGSLALSFKPLEVKLHRIRPTTP